MPFPFPRVPPHPAPAYPRPSRPDPRPPLIPDPAPPPRLLVLLSRPPASRATPAPLPASAWPNATPKPSAPSSTPPREVFSYHIIDGVDPASLSESDRHWVERPQYTVTYKGIHADALLRIYRRVRGRRRQDQAHLKDPLRAHLLLRRHQHPPPGLHPKRPHHVLAHPRLGRQARRVAGQPYTARTNARAKTRRQARHLQARHLPLRRPRRHRPHPKIEVL